MSNQGFEVPVVTGNELEDLRRLSDALTEQNNNLLNMVRNCLGKDSDGNIRFDGDFYTKNLITDYTSIYIGDKKPQNKLENINRELFFNKTKIVDNTSGVAPHEDRHQDGGIDELSHDGLKDFVANEHIDWTAAPTKNFANNGTLKTGDGGTTDYAEFEDDGTLKFNGAAIVYDDLQVSISNIRLPVSNAPTWRLYNHGIGGGVTFPVLGFAVDEYIYFDVQTQHSMKLNTILDNHIHFTTPTDGDAEYINFQLDTIVAGINGAWAVPTGSPFTSEHVMDGDYSDLHKLLDIADIPASNNTVSSVYKCKLGRIDASQDEYPGEVYLQFTDCHYQKDTVGSRLEASK